MRRRKLLISIGALGAGGTAAFGTEAFTSVEAERSVDVTVAGDSSAFLAIEPLPGDNARNYVSVESDDTVALDLDDGAGTQGSGVNQDAITEIEDLFKIINQGTQDVDVFFDGNLGGDAVTFRVTGPDSNKTTQGTKGNSLEGDGNAVELAIGNQVVVGITVDTLNNDASGSLVSDPGVTIRAEAEGTVPDISDPSDVRTVVSQAGDLGNNAGFVSIQDAINGNNPQNGAADGKISTGGTILVEDGTFAESVTIDVEGLTLEGAGADATTIDISSLSDKDGIDRSAVSIKEQDVTVEGFKIVGDEDTGAGITAQSTSSTKALDGVTIADNTISGIKGYGGGDKKESFGILVNAFGGSSDLAVENVEITNNTIEDIGNSNSGLVGDDDTGGTQGFGVFVEETDASGVTIDQNTIQNVRGAKGINGNFYPGVGVGIRPPLAGAAADNLTDDDEGDLGAAVKKKGGILNDKANVTVTNNTFGNSSSSTENELDLAVAGDATGLRISGNSDVSEIVTEGAGLSDRQGASGFVAPSGLESDEEVVNVVTNYPDDLPQDSLPDASFFLK